jgi:hypothetical protein
MSSPAAPRTYRRRLALIAVTDYDDSSAAARAEFNAGIAEQVAGWRAAGGPMRHWTTSAASLPYGPSSCKTWGDALWASPHLLC